MVIILAPWYLAVANIFNTATDAVGLSGVTMYQTHHSGASIDRVRSPRTLPEVQTTRSAFLDPTVRPDVLEGQSIECSAFLFLPDFEPNTCPALPSDVVAKEVASHAERGTWDFWRVRELSEWMRDDAYSEVLVGRVFVILDVKFAERLLIGMQRPATTAVIVDLTVLRTPREEWKIFGYSLPCWAA